MSATKLRDPGGVAKKRPVMAPRPVWILLDQLSKAALIDVVYDLVCQQCESADEPNPSELAEKLRLAITPVVQLRGDRMPKVVAS